MCGIGGIILKEGKVRYEEFGEIVDLATKLEQRGTDAFGFISINSDGSVKRLWKLPGSFSDQFEMLSKEMFRAMKGAKAVLLHTRAYTTGNPLYNHNNHPFRIEHLYLAHNGYAATHYYYDGKYHAINHRIPKVRNFKPDMTIHTDTYRYLFVPMADKLLDERRDIYSAYDIYELFCDVSFKYGVIGSFWMYDQSTKLITLLKSSMPLQIKSTDKKIIFGSNLTNRYSPNAEFVKIYDLHGDLVDSYKITFGKPKSVTKTTRNAKITYKYEYVPELDEFDVEWRRRYYDYDWGW